MELGIALFDWGPSPFSLIESWPEFPCRHYLGALATVSLFVLDMECGKDFE